jgi:hypothetical protein
MSEPKTVQLPWPGLLAVAAAIAGVVWYLAPLDTSRPTERGGVSIKLNREQDVDARLWQDPLATALAHEEQVRGIDKTKDPVSARREESFHSARALCSWIAKVRESYDLLVLPVLVSGGSYAEYGESRLRARCAVLEALGTNQLSPRDGEHIGYARMPLLSSRGSSFPSACEEPELNEDKSAPQEYFILPYEWCEPAFAGSAKRTKQVLILWVPEEELNDKPLSGLASLLAVLNVKPSCVKVIGPRTSTSLRAIVNEVTAAGYTPPDLNGAVIFSPTATVSEELLLRGTHEDVVTVEALLKKKVNGLALHRITATDSIVCRALISELGRRKVRLNLRDAPKNYCGGNDNVALISEWDTFYGRALPLSFAREVSGLDLDTLERKYPENIHAFQYLRGIDGMLPGASTQDLGAASVKKTDAKGRPRETIEGLNQADYLRRLAVQLEEKNRQLIRDGGGGLKAVGVLGSDVYDKLLVLKALRGALPGVLFFTNNLDARLGHPDEWNWARNLIVGSPFGLRLREQWKDNRGTFDLQGKILPFRDAYQTATYAATLFASNDQAAKLLDDEDRQKHGATLGLLGQARLFEIGQSGPYELAGLIHPKDEGPDLHPARDVRWWNGPRIADAFGIGFALTALIVWISLVLRGPQRKWSNARTAVSALYARTVRERGVWAALHRLLRQICGFSSWAVFAVGALVAWFVIAVVAYVQPSNGEPYIWMEGISIWPTETVRLLVALMAIWFLYRTNRLLRDNEATILEDFDLRPLKIFAATIPPPASIRSWEASQMGLRKRILPYRSAPLSSGRWLRQIIRLLIVRHWRVERKGRVVAQKLWRRYIRAGMLPVRFLRVLPLILFYFIAGICLNLLLGLPPVPGRGELSFLWDIFFVLLAVLASVGLTFYVADATMLNRRLIEHLVEKKTVWPPAAYQRLRQRWKVSAVGKQSTSLPPGTPPPEAPPESLSPRENSASVPPGNSTPDLPPERLLDEYLDIDLIATRTEVVGSLIYYPFILITLMIVSRISLFDNWTWPVGLFIVIAGNGGYAAWSAWMLRRTAENARQTALKNLNDILIARTAEGNDQGPEAKTARETIAMIKAEERGAFNAISRHPLVGALLLPSGGAGIWALTQYLPGLF